MIDAPTQRLDEGALRALVPRVLAGLVRRGEDFDAAEDALQEALVEALRVWPEHPPRDARAWLTTVATRRLVDAHRSEVARQRREETVLDGHVRGSARLANDLHDADDDATSAPPFSETMSQLVHEERYPALARLIASGAIDSRSDTDPARFEFGLARVLDGIEDLTPMGQRGSDARSSR